MAITINDGFLNNSPKALDTRSLKNGLQPYSSLQDVYDNYPTAYRAPGATVLVREDNYLITYWFRNGSQNSDLIRRTDETPSKLISTGTLTVGQNDQHIVINAVSNVTINLPSAANQYGKRYRFTRTDDGSFTVSIVGNIQERINNQASLKLVAKFESYEIEAANVGTTATPNPGWIITSTPDLHLEEEEFTTQLRYNKDKVRYHTLTENITYSLAPSNNKHGVVITDVIQASDDYIVTVPESFIVNGGYKKGMENIFSSTLLPATSSDKVVMTIRQENTTQLPVASDVHIMGDTVQGDVIETMYTFSPGGSEGDTTFTWYKADNASGLNATLIPNETNAGLELTQDLCQKYVRSGIIPVNADGDVGIEVFSPWEGPVTGCTTSNTTTLPGSFSPLAVANLAVWLADTKTLSGSQVLQWTDKSGLSNHFTPEDPTKRPTIANGLNNIQGVQFSGAQNLRGPALSDTDSYTIFTVGTLGINRGLDNFGDGWSIISYGSAKMNVVLDGNGVATNYSNDYVFNTSTAKLATMVLVNSGTNASSLTVYDAGVNKGTKAITNKTLRSSSVGFVMGQGGVPSGFSVGNIQEVVIYNRALNSTEITNINNYLKAKYNIA